MLNATLLTQTQTPSLCVIGVLYVIDTTAANEIVLLEEAEEFLYRYRQQAKLKLEAETKDLTSGKTSTSITGSLKGKFRNTKPKPPISTAISATRVQWINNKGITTTATEEEVGLVTSRQGTDNYPVLTSHCPGFVCYAEKQQPEILSNISTVKSSQQIIGSILKETDLIEQIQQIQSDGQSQTVTGTNSNSKDNKTNSNSTNTNKKYYHVSIQPCFDKKLEASRKVRAYNYE